MNEYKTANFRLTSELHKRLKMASVYMDATMGQIAETAIKEYLDAQEAKANDGLAGPGNAQGV